MLNGLQFYSIFASHADDTAARSNPGRAQQPHVNVNSVISVAPLHRTQAKI